jgi:hypothetical protein
LPDPCSLRLTHFDHLFRTFAARRHLEGQHHRGRLDPWQRGGLRRQGGEGGQGCRRRPRCQRRHLARRPVNWRRRPSRPLVLHTHPICNLCSLPLRLSIMCCLCPCIIVRLPPPRGHPRQPRAESDPSGYSDARLHARLRSRDGRRSLGGRTIPPLAGRGRRSGSPFAGSGA